MRARQLVPGQAEVALKILRERVQHRWLPAAPEIDVEQGTRHATGQQHRDDSMNVRRIRRDDVQIMKRLGLGQQTPGAPAGFARDGWGADDGQAVAPA